MRPRLDELTSGNGRIARNAEADGLLTAGIGVTVAVVLAGGVAQLVDYGVYGLSIPALDSNADGGIFGVVGDVALVGAAIAAGSVLVRVRPRRAATVALPLLLAFLALDKVLRIHDHVPHYLWVYLPLLGSIFVALVLVALRLPAPTRRLIGTGLALVTVSLFLHAYGEPLLRHLGASPAGWGYQIKAVVKHGAEVAGWLLIALGLTVGGARERDRTRQHQA